MPNYYLVEGDERYKLIDPEKYFNIYEHNRRGMALGGALGIPEEYQKNLPEEAIIMQDEAHVRDMNPYSYSEEESVYYYSDLSLIKGETLEQ